MQLALILLATQLVAQGVDEASRDLTLVDVTYTSGELTLAATLILPAGDGPFPAAVILQGSGGGRGATRHNAWAASFADLLAGYGVAVLLTDKRGCGQSEGRWRSATFDNFASDALAGVDWLRPRPDIDAARVGLVGLSQGGHIVPLAAERDAELAFLIDFAGGLTPMRGALFHEIEATCRQRGLDRQQTDLLLELTRASFLHLDTGDHFGRYLEARSAVRDALGGEAVDSWPVTRDDEYWTFWGHAANYDPLPHWRSAVLDRGLPCFVALGELDEQDNAEVVRSALRARHQLADPAMTFGVYPGVGHSLAEIVEHSFVFHPDLCRDLEAWLQRNVRDG